MRMHSLSTWLFGLVGQHISSVVQWTNIIACTGHLKIWIFMLTMEWIYQDLQPRVMCHLGVLLNCTSLKGELLVLSTSVCLKYPLCHYTCHSSAVWWWGNLLSAWRAPPFPQRCQGLFPWQFPTMIDMPKNKWLALSMFAWFNSTRLLLVQLPEEFSVQYEISITPRTKAWNLTVMCSHLSRYHLQ